MQIQKSVADSRQDSNRQQFVTFKSCRLRNNILHSNVAQLATIFCIQILLSRQQFVAFKSCRLGNNFVLKTVHIIYILPTQQDAAESITNIFQ
jgi:hypothetical protein